MFSKMIAKHFGNKKSRSIPATPLSWGRKARMETLEDRRVLTVNILSPGADIQAAIDNFADDGVEDTIFLTAGSYFQTLFIDDDDALSIIGLGEVNLFDGAGADTINISNSANVTLSNLNIIDADNDGIDADNVGVLTLTDLTVRDNGGDGVDAFEVDTLDISNSSFSDNDGHGLLLEDVGAATLEDILANDNDLDGLDFQNFNVPGSLSVFSGTFSNNGLTTSDDGIFVDGVAEVSIDTVLASGNGQDGVDVEDGNQPVNTLDVNFAAFDNNQNEGFEADADIITFTETRAFNNDNEGVEIDDALEVSITFSDFSFNGFEGLEIDSTPIVTIDQLRANSNGLGATNEGVDISGFDELTITTSEFLDNSQDGLIVFATPGDLVNITNVEASGNGEDGIDINGAAVAVLDTVGTRDNDGDGINAVGLAGLSINNSTGTGNGGSGVFVDGDGDLTDLDITFSEYSFNIQDGIFALDAGNIVLNQVAATNNADNGFNSDNALVDPVLIDSLFADNLNDDIFIV